MVYAWKAAPLEPPSLSADDAAVLYDSHVRGGAWEVPFEFRGLPAAPKLSSLGRRVRLDEHEHRNPYLSVYLTGAYRERSGSGDAVINRPAMVLHPTGAIHADETGNAGLDALVIEMDAGWLDDIVPEFQLQGRSAYWTGAGASKGAAALARAWLRPKADPNSAVETLSALLQSFTARAGEGPLAPAWLDEGICRASGSSVSAARLLRRNAASVARTVAAHRGESLREARRRERVGRAALTIRDTDLSLAAVAAECGFCDQAHMNRGFKAIFHRTPGELRERWASSLIA